MPRPTFAENGVTHEGERRFSGEIQAKRVLSRADNPSAAREPASEVFIRGVKEDLVQSSNLGIRQSLGEIPTTTYYAFRFATANVPGELLRPPRRWAVPGLESTAPPNSP
jgi:hypothetical protein